MTVLPTGEIGVLYEKDGYNSVSFTTVRIEDVFDSKQK
jgi:hypothetical protein